MVQKTVRVETKGVVQWIRLSRPDRLNAFSEQLGADLLEALQEGERSAGAGCLVLTGEGEAFCAGEDLDVGGRTIGRERPVLLGEALSREYNSIVQRIKKMEKPVVAAINGAAAGIGLGLAMACDQRAAAEGASFSEALLGSGRPPYSWAGFWLPRILGPARAMEVRATGRPMGARAALSLGLVDRVFPDADFAGEVTSIAEHLARRPAAVLALTKRTLTRAVAVGPDSALEYEVYLRTLAAMAENRAGAPVRN